MSGARGERDEADGMVDVPVHKLEIEAAGASLPSPEEVRQDSYTSKRSAVSDGKQRNPRGLLLCALISSVVLIVILGLALGIRSDDSGSNDDAGTSGAFGNPEKQTVTVTMNDVIAYLTGEQVSATDAFHDEESPQYKAARWLAVEDDFYLSVPQVPMSELEGYKYIFRYVMALNYFALSGDHWRFSLRFMSPVDVCQWELQATGGIKCNKDNVPTILYIFDNNLQGKMPTENGKLTSLTELVIEDNLISGTIPTELCQLSNLKWLSLHQNRLQGSIPTCIGQLTSMELFKLSKNLLQHSIMSSEICKMKSLELLHLSANDLNGHIDDCFNTLTALTDLRLSNNFISGTLPVLHDLTQLQSLLLDDNFLSGDVNHVDHLPSITHMYLDGNLLSGDLATFGMEMSVLRALDLSDNNITTTAFPSNLFLLPELELLDLSWNRIHGALPTDILVNPTLRFFSAHTNDLTGPIPSQIAHLEALEHLDLSRNSLNGSLIDAGIGNLERLVYLFVAENPFDEEPIPASFANLTRLEELSLKGTNRIGELPAFIGSLEKLFVLDLGNNNLVGTIPLEYGNLRKMQYLLLNRNHWINGTIPSSFVEMESMVHLIVDATRLVGDLVDLCGLPNIRHESNFASIIADCGYEEALITCNCCACCDEQSSATNSGEGCSQSEVASLDLQWEVLDGRRPDNETIDFGFNFTTILQNEG